MTRLLLDALKQLTQLTVIASGITLTSYLAVVGYIEARRVWSDYRFHLRFNQRCRELGRARAYQMAYEESQPLLTRRR